VIVALTAAPADATLTTVSITAATVTHTFSLAAGRGLSSTPISFGLYLPSSVGGEITVAGSATGTDTGACAGYRGNTTALVLEGGTANVDLALRPRHVAPLAGPLHGVQPRRQPERGLRER
jgi:hypothetical protein